MDLVNDSIVDFQKVQREKILKSYGIGTDIQKGGEGSKGGKVIGHTKSGKPIYAEHGPMNYEDFTKQDHLDAAESHENERGQHKIHGSKESFHYGRKQHHLAAAEGVKDAGFLNERKVEKSELSEELKKAYEVLGMGDIIEKGEEVTIDKKEFIEEHKDLIETLETPTKKDDKEEAESQTKELEEVLDKEK